MNIKRIRFLGLWLLLSVSNGADSAPAWAERHPGLLSGDIDAINHHDWTVVIVELEVELEELPSTGSPSLSQRRDTWDHRKQQIMDASIDGETRLRRRLEHLPLTVIEIRSVAALEELATDSRVKALYSNQRFYPVLNQSLPLVSQPDLVASGVTGTDTAIVVIDTGVNYTRTAFGGCTAVGVPDSCRVIYFGDIAADDGALDDSGHGTNVAAIAAAVAPGTGIISLDVISAGYVSTTDMLAAMDWAIMNQVAYNIVAINMSLAGTTNNTSACQSGNPFYTAALQAIDVGINVVAAAGNSGYTNGLAIPACTPNVISVGAVYDSNVGSISWSSCTDSSTQADQVTCFSNSAAFLTLFAPGALISAGGATLGGTSQASPHVAGAIALLADAYPADTPDQRLQRMLDAGIEVTDTRNGVTKPRLDFLTLTQAIDNSAATDVPVLPWWGLVLLSGALVRIKRKCVLDP